MKLFTKPCSHKWVVTHKSNAIQCDAMGYPLRLYIYTCAKCGKSEQMWMDVAVEELDELKTGQSVLVTWEMVG